MTQKMNTVLAAVEHSTATVNRLVSDYTRFFKDKGGAFLGIKKTYSPREGYPDDPTKTGTTLVTTTVDEKIDWAEKILKDHFKNVFTVEATNSLGAPTVELVVEGQSFGNLTALELMRLKSILTNKEFETMYSSIPVRSDAEVWNPSDDPDYAGRNVFETELVKGVAKTTETEEVILKDPNLDPQHLPSNYNAKVTTKRKIAEIGDYTMQKFSGEWNHRQRAELLRRRGALLEAVIKALKEVNDVQAAEPNLDVEKFVDYIHRGTVK